jgi:rubrerythrin
VAALFVTGEKNVIPADNLRVAARRQSGHHLKRGEHNPARKCSEMEEYWVCPECLDKYDIKEKRVYEIGGGPFIEDSKMGICPMCSEYRILLKAEPLKESGSEPTESEKQEGIECLPLTH